MTITINFLGADLPLTKSVYADGSKDAYPLVKNFTSYEEKVKDIKALHAVITAHGDLGHCLLKGKLVRPLVNEPRAGTTRGDDFTQYICLDFDNHVCADIDEELSKLGIGDISYVIQYSSSHGLEGNEGMVSAHIFMLLDAEMPAPVLKAWLMGLNLDILDKDRTTNKDDHNLTLARAKMTLHWPLDVTTCQNDKLIYIAPPMFKGMKDPLKQRVKLIKKKLDLLPITRIGERNLTKLKEQERAVLNALRVKEGLPKRTAKTSWVGTKEIQNKPDRCNVTEIREQGEYVRLNINGGDSWAYYHSKDDFEFIYDFKSDIWFRTKEFVPDYYQTKINERAALNATPTEDGDLILAFRDMKTAEYYNGLYNPELKKLELYRAKNERQLEDWMRSHGRHIGEFIPVWDIQYNPREDWVIDEDRHLINTFRPSRYMGMEPAHHDTSKFSNILSIIRHLLGESGKDTTLSDAFLNWFAVILQRKAKPLTAWVVHGCEGTGKGYFFNKIAAPLLALRNAMSVTVGNIEDQYNGWIEGKLFILIDEIEVDDFREKGRITAKLRNYITEPTIALRRMRQAVIDAPNYASFLFSSNRPQPVYIPPTDRRYNVGNYQPEKLPRPDDKVIAAELEYFAQWLLAHPASIEEANKIVETDARNLIQKLGVSSITETCNAMKEGNFETLWLAMMDDAMLDRAPVQTAHIVNAKLYNELLKEIARGVLEQGTKLTLSRDEMAIILQYNVGNIRPEPNRITSLLRHNGIETKQIRHKGNKTYGIHVDWVVPTELLNELKQIIKPSAKLRKIK